MQIYVVKVGGKLYLDSKSYGFFQSTTPDLLKATWFEDREEAELHAKKTIGGKVIEYTLSDNDANESEIDMLKASIVELQRQRDEFKDMNDRYKLIIQEYQKKDV